jgi:hypothetical protein
MRQQGKCHECFSGAITQTCEEQRSCAICSRGSRNHESMLVALWGNVSALDVPICHERGSRGDWRPSCWRLSPSGERGQAPPKTAEPVPALVPRVSRDDYPLPLHLALATVTEKDWVANLPPGSVARTVTPNVPCTVGVHLIRPVDELIVMPAGIGATRL